MVSAAGGRKGYVAKSRHKAYRKLRKKGNSKSKSARIANAGVTKAGRQAMARKAAATRKRKRKSTASSKRRTR
jgi:pantothenate kinase